MRSTNLYPAKLVSSLTLLLLCLLNVLNVAAQDSPNITPPAGSTCMPHPETNASAVYTYAYTGGGNTPVWSTRGEIAIVSVAADGESVNIKSTGYGKGRLYVTFNQAGCAGSQREHIDVFKTIIALPAPNNRIVGPACVSAGEKVTYSINPVLSKKLFDEIGIDTYEWKLPVGWAIDEYAAGDHSSITITIPGPLTQQMYILDVKVGKCNTFSNGFEIKPAMATPAISPVPAGCLDMTKTELVLNIDNYNSAYAYKWILPSSSNWSFAPGYTGTESQVKILVDNTSNSVQVQATRGAGLGCNAAIETFEVKRAMPTGSKIAGPTCVDGSASHLYNIVDADNKPLAAGVYTWTFIPNNPAVTDAKFSVNNPSGPSVNFTAGTSGGVLSAVSKGCSSSAITLPITISTAAPQTMTGPSCVNPGATGLVYTVDPAVTGATSYTWTLSGTLTSTSTLINGTNSITVNAGNSGGSIRVVANNGTCPSQSLLKPVSLNPVAPTSITSSKSCINRGVNDNITFTVATPVAGQNYDWQVIYPTGVTSGWTVLTGSATNGGSSITYRTNGTVGSYRVEARGVRTGCSATAWVSSATIATARAISITRTVIPDENGNPIGDLLVATPVTGATYRWTRTSSTDLMTVLSETGYTLDLSTVGDDTESNYCVTATINGCTTNSFCLKSKYNTSGARLSSGQTSPELLSSQVTVYPNPTTDGELTLQLPAFRGQAGVVLKNLQGQVVYKTQVSKTKSKLSAGKLTSGVYLLQVSLDGRVVTKKVTVKK